MWKTSFCIISLIWSGYCFSARIIFYSTLSCTGYTFKFKGLTFFFYWDYKHSNKTIMSTVLGLLLKYSHAQVIIFAVKKPSLKSSLVIRFTGTSNESAVFRLMNNLTRSTSFSCKMFMKSAISFGMAKKLITSDFGANDYRLQIYRNNFSRSFITMLSSSPLNFAVCRSDLKSIMLTSWGSF